MRKNIRSLAFIMAASLLPLAYMSGCNKISYDSVSEDEVIEYAVNAVLNHDKNYIVKLADRALEPETTTAWVGDDGTGNSNNSENNVNAVSANDSFGLSGFTILEAGYEVADRYPEGNDGFSMVAINKNKLLILKFNVTNNSDGQAVLNMMDNNISYRCVINGSKSVNVQMTALLNDLNTYNGTFEAGETKEMVLIFQISEEISDNINNISLYVAKDSESSVIAITQ